MHKFFHVTVLFIVGMAAAHGQVIINEYSAANVNGITTQAGKHEDWVELYNTSNTAIDLVDYYLSDNETAPYKW